MVTITLTCVTCDEDAGDIGDYGALGTPDLTTDAPKRARPDELPFGYFYEALQAIALRPRDIEERATFLSTHRGHFLVQWTDATSDEHLPPELLVVLENRRKSSKKQAGSRRAAAIAAARKSEWSVGSYGVRCTRCGTTCVSKERDFLRPIESPTPLSREATRMLVERWGKRLSTREWYYRLPPLVDPDGEFMPKLLRFVTTHRPHRLDAFLRTV